MRGKAGRAGASGVRRRRVAAGVVLLVALGLLPAAAYSAGGGGAAAQLPDAELWIVQLVDPSLAVYSGGIAGLAPTSPRATGAQRLEVTGSASRAYLGHLEARQDAFAAGMQRELGRQVQVAFRYRNVFNGLAVRVSAGEAARLAALPQVAAVYPDQLRELDTDVSHEVIGSGAVWEGQTGSGLATRGEGVLVGMLDTGVNPDHPSFAATDGDGFTHTNPFGSGNYVGVCDPAHPQHEPICNDKLVGAWNFHTGSATARDNNDHGSHTGSTMAGNRHEATFTIGQTPFTRTVQGVAPRANIISYKVCEPSCPATSMIAAVNQAVADGVQVLNFSISGEDDPWRDPVDLAFLEAFNAGVFVAASAGNDGPGVSTVAKTAPWNASVAASTTSRVFAQTLDVTSEPVPPALVGVAAVPGQDRAPTEVVEAEVRDAGLVDEGNLLGCTPFPAGAFAGAVALIERGDCPFADKVNNAAVAGAVVVVVVNQTAGPPITMGGLETTSLPSVMVTDGSGQQLRALIAEQAPAAVRVRLNVASELITDPAWADVVAGFSSRGPSRHELLAPTLTAPGVNILAAGREVGGDPQRYAVLQGTSMAAPHAAGAGALLATLHPQWSPAQIRSALAGTADPTRLVAEDGERPAGVFDQGSGLLDVAAAGRVGLVLDESYGNFRAADPLAGGDPKSLNVPAMVNRDCRVSCSWTRTVSSVADVSASYTAAVEAAPGATVTVEPAAFTIEPGGSRQLTITAEVAGAPAGEWLHAAVRLDTGAVHAGGLPVAGVRWPVAVIPPPSRLAIDPAAITVQQEPGQQVAHQLTIGNTGGNPLQWQVVQGEPEHRPASAPAGLVTPVATAPAPSAADDGELRTGRNPQPAGDVTGPRERPAASELPDGTVTVTHSASPEITPLNSIACAVTGTGRTVDNGYLRTFTLEDFQIFSDFEVSSVSFGIESLHGVTQTLTVNLYTLDAQPLIYDNLSLLGTAEVTLEPRGPGILEVPVAGTVPEGSTLVVEVAAPDVRDVGGFFIGSNTAGQSAPSYIRAQLCGSIGPEPVDLAAIGFPDMHVVMDVTGTAQAPACDVPGGTPWADAAPLSGTVAPGGTGQVTLTLDSTGMSPGDVHEATLCLETNDPARPFGVVPVTLTVTDGDGGDPSAGQEIIATVPDAPGEGSLVISVDPDDRTVILPPVQVATSGDRLATAGELRPVTVTDTRTAADPAWDASAQITDFTAEGASFGGGFLGWTPEVVSQSPGQQAVPGAPVAPGFPTGDGLSVPRTLASAAAGAGTGVATLGAGLRLEIPVDTPAGTYVAVLTTTAI